MKATLLLCLLMAASLVGFAQSLPGNLLKNSSFEEGEIGAAITPVGWYDCGTETDNPVDLHDDRSQEKIYRVPNDADAGDRYIGLMASSDGSTGCIYQELAEPLLPGEFDLLLEAALPRRMKREDQRTGKLKSYDHPIGLEVVGITPDDQVYILASIPRVESSRWERFYFEGMIDVPIKTLVLRTIYAKNKLHNGYVLVDRVEFVVREFTETIPDTKTLAGNVLQNTSFEQGRAGHAMVPFRWKNCGSKEESPTDLHSSSDGVDFFEVRNRAADGDKYIGMVTRSNGTTECICQEIPGLLAPGTYDIALLAALPDRLQSYDRRTNRPANYAQPVMLEIVGISTNDRAVVLATTDRIEKDSWEMIRMEVSSPVALKRIELRTIHIGEKPYNGAVLVDRFELAVR